LRLLADYLSVENEDGSESMEVVEVNARYDGQGKLIPTSFIWQERMCPIESIGRRWQDDAGEHILVMVKDKKVYELLHSLIEKRWYLRPISPEGRFA
jgi:hypothetical protein